MRLRQATGWPRLAKRSTDAGANPMAKNRRDTESLRTTIDCLPRETRLAMLEGVRAHPIVVGAYTDRDGGLCPMLAAHRHGGRTDLLAFARSWDRFTGVRRARRATERELRVLVSHLEASLLADDPVDFEGAIAEHRRLAAGHARGAVEPVEPAIVALEPRGPIVARRLRPSRWTRRLRRSGAEARVLEQVRRHRDGLEAQAEIDRELAAHCAPAPPPA